MKTRPVNSLVVLAASMVVACIAGAAPELSAPAVSEPAGPDEEVVITDMGLLEPGAAISERTEKGMWWRRPYTLPDDDRAYALVCVEEQDLDDPASCIAPPLTLPLKLEGWYEVWVRTYRHGEGGGIDVRLSGEPYFMHMDPLQIATRKDAPAPHGSLVDLRYRAADLTGQDLVFQQPYGTYESQSMLCNASLAGVRLVKLSEEQVATIQAERARMDTKIIGYDNDGFSYFHRWAVHDPACIARLIEPLRDQSAAFLNYELGGLGGLFIPTPYTGMYQMTGHTRHGDYRANAFYRWCFENDVNIVDVLTERAHEVGVKLFVSLMMERSFSPDRTMKEHPEWKVKRGRGRWDYAIPEVQDYQVQKITWIMEHHDIDGFIVDFTRYGYYFNQDEPNKFGHMNAFLRKLRAATDIVNAKKERKVLLHASFGDESWHLKHWGTGKLEDQGLDVQTWLDEGLFDMIMPEGPGAMDYVEMAKDSRTAVWPRFVARVSIKGHESVDGQEGPKDIERGVQWAYDGGAPGIFLFNHDTWPTFGRLGFREELPLRCKTEEVYGLQEGPEVNFASWYPSIEQRKQQRAALKPVTALADAKQCVDGEVLLPIRNTFPNEITAAVSWQSPEKSGEGQTWSITPETRSVTIGAGEVAELPFRLTGQAPAQSTVPHARVELFAEEQRLLRHRLPVRAVSHAVCKRYEEVPEFGSLDGQECFLVGGEGNANTWMATACDGTHLYAYVDCSGIDVSTVAREAQKRDSREVYAAHHVQFLVDPTGAEQEFFEFRATPAGGQWDARQYYDSFAGHFTRKTNWNAEWTTETTWREDGYTIRLAIPLETFCLTPAPGTACRANVVAQIPAGKDARRTASWSAPEAEYSQPKCFGRLVFE